MYRFIHMPNDILTTKADIMTIPVNCVGVMGKGLAAQFKRARPDEFKIYKQRCDEELLSLGTIDSNNFYQSERWEARISEYVPQQILFFPTKDHWKELSDLYNIRDGLKSLHEYLQNIFLPQSGKQELSIALPALGCGLGGLNWNEVCYLMVSEFANSTSIEAIVYSLTHLPLEK